MKIYAVRDETAEVQKDLAYLFYYEIEKQFYIELPENADPWETPLLLDSFVKRNKMTVNSYWALMWVQQRIVPIDRQNIGEILRDNGLEEYDEYKLLMLTKGRCAQDDYYLVPLDENELPEEIIKRYTTRVEDILPLDDFSLLVFFRDGSVKKCDLREHFEETRPFGILLEKPEYFGSVRIQIGGYGVTWDVNMNISDTMLYQMGEPIPLTMADFQNFVAQRVVNATEAAEILDCSRQNVIDLTKRGKLHPIKSSEKNTLYLRGEILKRNWQ